MRRWWRSVRVVLGSGEGRLDEVNRLRSAYARLGDEELRDAGAKASTLAQTVAAAAAVASRVLGLDMFDEQLRGALSLADGKIVEMRTGEGKTLAAVPAVAWYARSGKGVHVLTANDYLARRDADWMRGIYEWLGLRVAAVGQNTSPEERRAAYRADITYATANEVGFDLLRDQLALDPADQVHRCFAVAVIDEADSILIDEARIPLVIAGGASGPSDVAARADGVARALVRGVHYHMAHEGRDVQLTDAGIHEVERRLRCSNLFEPQHLMLLTAVQDSLHAHVLLRRDVDYLVKDGAIVSVDEIKGRTVKERRWPSGLQTALEWKEGVARKVQGRILGSMTVENLVALYPQVCGMTGTAATQADEFRDVYGLEVETIPTHRPIVRVDHRDSVFDTKLAKEDAVLEEIRCVHETGRPVLVGTASVEESERLSRALGDRPHQVLNARYEDTEAAIIARAGERGAITISTNMAGRGVDIRLGQGVAELGGLHVIGTNRHESQRIDDQLRGRAGRQGDPGSSRFFVSLEDEVMTRYRGEGVADDVDVLQQRAEGDHLDARLFLRKYESVVEGQRQIVQRRRQEILTGASPSESERERRVRLATIDELWSDYRVAVGEMREGTVWITLGGVEPWADYLARIHAMFQDLERTIDEETAARVAQPETFSVDPSARGATWTYLTTDEPFGTMSDRVRRGMVRMARKALG